MKILISPQTSTWFKVLKRPTQVINNIEAKVNEIFKEIQQKGDLAVYKYTSLFDNVTLTDILVSQEEIMASNGLISSKLKEAIKLSKNNIEKFHSAQQIKTIIIETTPGVLCWQENRAIEKVGLYIPGGTAPLFSTVLMLAIPAQIADCKEVVLCSPPDENGKINPVILYAAQLCGVTKIYKVGGIQAIAALTFGTESISKVHKIFGPGNQFVTVAKQLATKYGVAIDLPAGPSELLVVADDTANPTFVASDLLSQAEHGADSQVILVTTSKKIIDMVTKEIELQIKILPRKSIAEKAIANSKIIYVSNNEIALNLINEYGPEHFIICMSDENYFIKGIQNAGSVFIGNYTPESAGDYASGTNHTLPTNGFSKSYSGLNLNSFLKSITFQKITKKGLKNIGQAIELMAESEGLLAHKNSVSIRLKSFANE